MARIESLAEGGAFMDTLDALDGRGWSVGDADIEALRCIWLAGRDWAREAGAQREAQLRAAIASALDDFDRRDELSAVDALRDALAAPDAEETAPEPPQEPADERATMLQPRGVAPSFRKHMEPRQEPLRTEPADEPPLEGE